MTSTQTIAAIIEYSPKKEVNSKRLIAIDAFFIYRIIKKQHSNFEIGGL